jgi:hypothetical protein
VAGAVSTELAEKYQCPLCTRRTRFARVTAFMAHVLDKHADVVSAEEDATTIELLDAGLERRKIRDAEMSSVKDKLAS